MGTERNGQVGRTYWQAAMRYKVCRVMHVVHCRELHVARRFHAACCTPLPVLPCCKVPRILPDPYSMLFHACVCECLCVFVCVTVFKLMMLMRAACCTPLPVLPCCNVPRILPDPYSMLFHACVCECLCVCVCVTVLKLMLLVLSLLYVLEFQPPSPILVCKSHVCAVLSPGVRSLCSLSPVVNRVSGLPPSAPCDR